MNFDSCLANLLLCLINFDLCLANLSLCLENFDLYLAVVGHRTMPDFKKKLFDIARRITSDTLRGMKFMCDLLDGVKNSIDDPLKFLGELEKWGKIYPGDVTYLVLLLEQIDNLELAGFVRQTVSKFSP